MKSITTWIVISDGARARIVCNDGPGHGLKALPDLTFEAEHQETQEIMADKQGRVFDRQGPGRHAMEIPNDPKRLAKQYFARVIAKFLHEKLQQNAFDRLIVFAAPTTLGDLRAAFSEKVKAKIKAEVPKDLTRIPNDELAPHLVDILAF